MKAAHQNLKGDRKLLGVRVTVEQRERIVEAARREQRSVSSFIVRAALEAAEESAPARRKGPEEVRSILRAAREEVRAANPENRSLLDELVSERRKEATGA
jgi:hypothetical protein